ncbi:putative quinol monooxygenase [Minwuia sp.]|uniref:putative quinol monooxygenase n=1 Tax=Minwuia sp. TaxID=2493630 RepID=UPI003A91B218
MIVVSGTFRLGASSVEAAKAAAIEMARETRKEDGCITYAFFQSIEEPTTFRVFEEWESDVHLKAHFEVAHMKTFRARLGELEVLERNVKKYVVADVEGL